ncbi:MAG: hypothetical protein HW416_3390 [Chloroflexi bacterium]|nr:hypothetical protein [Chloroflexota bacterium]
MCIMIAAHTSEYTLAMVRKQVYLTVAQNRELKRQALTQGVAEAALIRRALDTDLQTGEPSQPAAAGSLDVGAIQALLAFARARARTGPAVDWKFDREALYEDRRS